MGEQTCLSSAYSSVSDPAKSNDINERPLGAHNASRPTVTRESVCQQVRNLGYLVSIRRFVAQLQNYPNMTRLIISKPNILFRRTVVGPACR